MPPGKQVSARNGGELHMNTARSLTMAWTAPSIIFGLALLVGTGILCYVAWRRSGFARRTGVLEGLRLLIVALVVITLNQPELLERFRPEERRASL